MVIVEVTHLPSGQVFESGRFPDEKFEALRDMIETSSTLTFSHPNHGTYLIPAGVLNQSVVRIRYTQ